MGRERKKQEKSYKPYTLEDYRLIKEQAASQHPSTLGPDLQNEEYLEKVWTFDILPSSPLAEGKTYEKKRI